MNNRKWHLVNANKRAQDHPGKFEIPSPIEIEQLKVGDIVKVIVEYDDLDVSNLNRQEAERLWIVIENIEKENFTGKIDNDPEVITSLHDGDRLKFRKEHIIAIWSD